MCVPVTEPGPPSPPDSVTVEEVTDSTAQLAWSRGRDNGSPIANYFVQTRTPFTVGWQRVTTGGRRPATVVQMDPSNLCRGGRGQSGGSAVERRQSGADSRSSTGKLRVNVAAHI